MLQKFPWLYTKTHSHHTGKKQMPYPCKTTKLNISSIGETRRLIQYLLECCKFAWGTKKRMYLQVVLLRSLTCSRYASRIVAKLFLVSLPSNSANTTVFWGEFGLGTLAIWNSIFMEPWPWSPPSFRYTLSVGMEPSCHVRMFALEVQKTKKGY